MSAEKIYGIIVAMIASFIFAYSMNSVGEILKEFGRREAQFRVEISNLKQYLRQRDVDPIIQIRVHKYLEYLYQEQSKEQENCQGMLNSLNLELQEEVQKDVNGKLLRKYRLFRGLSPECIDRIALKIKEIKIMPEEYLFHTGDESDKIFFLLSGQMRVLAQKKMPNSVKLISVGMIDSGALVGEQGFISGRQREVAMKATTISELAYLSKQDFFEILQEFQTDLEKYHQQKDSIIIYRNTEILKQSCQSCHSQKHFMQQCPLITLQLDREKCLLMHRKKMERRKKCRPG